LEAILGFAPLGVVKEGSGRFACESLRRVAFAIIREWRSSGVRSFVLVPVRGRAGTTALTLALVSELNKLGRPTVAIEANQFSPDLRYASVHGTQNGTNGHINGTIDIKDAGRIGSGRIVDGRIGDSANGHGAASLRMQQAHALIDADDLLPRRIPICRHFGGPCLTLECIESLVALALATNDLVILDAPGLMNSADAEMLIQMPAAAILLVREGRDLMPEVVAAAHALERLSPPVVGAILNGIAIDPAASPQKPVTMILAGAGDSPPVAVEESYQE
jgi:polysaccharide biosynthesis transport protein